MFRVVKTLDSDEPAFFLLCDHRQCMDARRGVAIIANTDDYRLTKRQFLKAAMDEGWWIDLEGAYCPVHARELVYAAREAQEAAKQAVIPPGLGEIQAFGRAR